MESDNQQIDEVSHMFEAARSFIGGAKIIIDGDGIEENGVIKHPTLPVIVCSVIAVEIAIKALLKLNGLPRPSGDGHDLKLLFEALPASLQIELLAFQVAYTDIPAPLARQMIYEEKDVFKTWRYAYEKSTLATAPSFLFGLALALSEYIRSTTPIERSDNGWLFTTKTANPAVHTDAAR